MCVTTCLFMIIDSLKTLLKPKISLSNVSRSRLLITISLQNPRSQPLTANAFTESSLTWASVMSSGTAGTENHLATSAAPVSLTTGSPVCACGPTRSLSAETRVRFGILTQKQLFCEAMCRKSKSFNLYLRSSLKPHRTKKVR